MTMVVFTDEPEASKWAWLFEPMGWDLCCANGYMNAWCAPEKMGDTR